MAKQSLAHDKSEPLPVLLTRPEGQGRAFSRRLTERFGASVRTMLSPLMTTRFLATEVPSGDFAAVIFTSMTGVSAARTLQTDLPDLAYCVGHKTAEAARAAGFHALSADGDAEALLSLILADPPAGRLLHLRGEEARGNLAERLAHAGVPTLDLVVYRQEPQPLTPEASDLLRRHGPVILPLFSPRSAALVAEALPTGRQAQLYLAALSPAVAQSVAFSHARLVTAARPDADAMLDALADLIVAASPP